MSKKVFTNEEMEMLRSNPYTYAVRGCKFFCVYGGRILPIRFRYVPSSVELID